MNSVQDHDTRHDVARTSNATHVYGDRPGNLCETFEDSWESGDKFSMDNKTNIKAVISTACMHGSHSE